MTDPTPPSNDPWRTSLEHFTSAMTHSVNASRLLAAGTVALGAAATAYLWDEKRRDEFMKSVRGMMDTPTAWWSGQSRQDPKPPS